MTREEAIQWLKVINTKEFGWDEFALQESQREIRERCEQGVREAIDMAIEALSEVRCNDCKWNDDVVEVVRCKDCRYADECHKSVQHTHNEPNTVTIGYSQIKWCSRGERREE